MTSTISVNKYPLICRILIHSIFCIRKNPSLFSPFCVSDDRTVLSFPRFRIYNEKVPFLSTDAK